MTAIVLRNPYTGHENGEEIEVDIFNRDFDDELEIIETDKGQFARMWENYSSTDPYGWYRHD